MFLLLTFGIMIGGLILSVILDFVFYMMEIELRIDLTIALIIIFSKIKPHFNK